jgi:hypothetical protein
VRSKGVTTCDISDAESRNKTRNKIQKIIYAPLTPLTILGIIGLAVAVNSIEFVCSAGLPAVYTYVLSIHPLSSFQYYAYIMTYVFFFMLDDLVIFGGAVLAASSSFGERYVKYTKPLGGIIMITMGIWLIFFPDLLR